MEYITLNNGVTMPMIGFGTWDVRGKFGKQVIMDALKVGYRLIDTAQMYDNESIVGQAIHESGIDRKTIFITTKLDRTSASYEKAKAAIEGSLQRLKTDYIDLLLIHEPYSDALGMYQALKEAYALSKVRAIGISNFDRDRYDQFIKNRGIIPMVDQVESHVYFSQLKLKDHLMRHGTIMQSWGSFTEGRRDIFNDPVLLKIATKHQKTAAQVALRYLTQQGIPVIPKTVHVERMKENFNSLDFDLDQADLGQIRRLD